jgi:hypothetical protein
VNNSAVVVVQAATLFFSGKSGRRSSNMIHPQGADWLGYLAAMLVFSSFYARTIVVLRLVAITSNMAFIGYAVAKGLYPVLVLHVVLLPLNCLRLAQLRAVINRSAVENGQRGTIHLNPSVSDKTISGVDSAARDVGPRDGIAATSSRSSARS